MSGHGSGDSVHTYLDKKNTFVLQKMNNTRHRAFNCRFVSHVNLVALKV